MYCRPDAARGLHQKLSTADLPQNEVLIVIEGEAKRGVQAGQEGRVRTVHAAGSGDDAIVDEVARQHAIGDGREVIVVTADRELRDRVEAVGACTKKADLAPRPIVISTSSPERVCHHAVHLLCRCGLARCRSQRFARVPRIPWHPVQRASFREGSRRRSFDTGSDETVMSAESGRSPRDLEAFESH